MVRLLLLTAALLLAGSSLAADAPPAAPAPQGTRLQASANGRYLVRMRVLEDKTCRVEVADNSGVQWQIDRCVASVDDLLFVSNDGDRFWILVTLPEKPAPKGKAKAPHWTSTPVAIEYDKTGEIVATRKLAELVPAPEQRKVQHLKKRFKWLSGVVGVPGKPPRVTANNELEFETLGSSTPKKLSF